MQDKEIVIRETDGLPETLVQEMPDFVSFLKTKAPREPSDTGRLSESALGKDWLKPEEEDAWRNV